MKNILQIILITFFTFAISSCAKKEESTTAGAAAPAPAISTFNGTFNGTCAGANSKTDVMVITDTTATEGEIVYSDSGCSTKEYGHNINYTVESTVTAAVDNKSVSKIEGTTTTSFHTIYTDDRVSNANSGSWCGKSDWVKDTPKDVTGLDCSDDFGTTYGAAGVKKYDIWYISGNTFMHSEFNSDGYASSLDYTKTKE
jgi:hypothetical protein